MSEAQLGSASKPGLKLDVRDDEIIITLPGPSYSVTCYKPANSPQLHAKNLSMEDDRRPEMSLSDFLARAWTLANEKARSLGWIVSSRSRKSNVGVHGSILPAANVALGGCDDTLQDEPAHQPNLDHFRHWWCRFFVLR